MASESGQVDSLDVRLLVGASPHVRDSDEIRRIMWTVAAALAPAALISLYLFGLRALGLYALAVAAAEATEAACLKARGRPVEHALDGSAFLTGMLLAMVLPASVAWYVPVVGGAFAIAIAKHAFGGLGNNIWNPALAARVFLQFAYPAQISLSQWPVPRMLWGAAPDAQTMATPLAKAVGAVRFTHLELLFGNGLPGGIGETCKVALIAGGLFLIARRVVDWRIPVACLGTVFVLTWLLPARAGEPAWADDPVYHLLAGGLMIGALFMATDMVTTPVTRRGKAVFGVGCGLLVALIRRYGGYPEGVAYSIVLMNTFTPLIDRWVQPTFYGARTPKATPRGT